MQHKRILVLGCSGSGKTTFACKFGDVTGLPVVHLDKLFWQPGWTMPTKEDYHTALRQALAQDAWIMDGDYSSTLPMRLARCDAVIYFNLPRLICLWGVLTRVMKSHGKVRPDMGDGCPERFDWAFVKYTWNFQKNQGAGGRALIRESGKPVEWICSRRQARRFIKRCEDDHD